MLVCVRRDGIRCGCVCEIAVALETSLGWRFAPEVTWVARLRGTEGHVPNEKRLKGVEVEVGGASAETCFLENESLK